MWTLDSDDLGEVLYRRAQVSPEGTLFIHNAERWKNQQFLDVCLTLAARLQVEGGERAAVAVSAESSAWLPFLLWSAVLAKIDLWLLPASPNRAALDQQIRSLPVGMVYSDRPELDEHDRLGRLASLLDQPPLAHDPRSKLDSGRHRRAAFVFQTSGTEGAPKTIRCEHWQFAKVLCAMQACGALRHAMGATVFLSQPLLHSYGLCSFLEYCAAGGCVVLPSETSPLGPAGDLMQVGSDIEAIEGVPYFWSQFAKLQKRMDLPELRHLGLGGGRLDPAVMASVLQRYPQATVSVRYGLTETPSVATHKIYAPPHGADWSSSGSVVPAYHVEIRDTSGQVVPDGTEGEIHVMGDCVAAEEGVLSTGDLGFFNRQRELVVTGRRSAFIKRRGLRMSPEMIETAASGCAGVVDCRAVGVADRLILEVVSDVDLSIPRLLQQLRERLPATMVPDEVRMVSEIARTYSGKIKRSG